MNLKLVTPALAVILTGLVLVGAAAPRGIQYFSRRAGPVSEAALTSLPSTAKPLLILSLDGGYWAHRECWAGLVPVTIVYDSGAVITLPPKRSWVRGQLGARELAQLRELAAQTDLPQYAGKALTALNGGDLATLHVFSAVSGPSVEVQISGYSPFDYNQPEWQHGSTPAPLARLIDALFALREIEAAPYVLPSARLRVVDTGQSCAWKCPWPRRWPRPVPGSREVPLRSGDLHELDAQWEQACPPLVHGGRSQPRPREFCKGHKQFAWCAGPVFPGVPDGVTEAAPPHR